MTSKSKDATTDKMDDNFAPPDPSPRPNIASHREPIPVEDPPVQDITDLLRNFGIKEHAFSAGPDLTKEDYLRLRVLWCFWPDQFSFEKYKPGNPALPGDEAQSEPSTEFISPDNARIADAIYNAVKPQMQAYLEDLRQAGDGDLTRSPADCGIFDDVRCFQYLVSSNVQEDYDDHSKKLHFRRKVCKTEAALPQDPHVSSTLDAGRDEPRPTTPEDAGVNTALSIMLYAIHRLIRGVLGKDNPAALAAELSKAPGLKYLDWLPLKFLLHLTDRSSGSAPPKQLITARVDGYLCRRVFESEHNDDEFLSPLINTLPLALFEGKPFTRLSAASATRWQESAEIAAWVSTLDDRYEKVGLLNPSASGRKRRLLVSQGRHELWIIIAEYGDQWKQFIRGMDKKEPVDSGQSQDGKDDAGPEDSGSPKETEPQSEIPGPGHFCTMQEWGPYDMDDADHMDCFTRRMIGFEVELAQNWPVGEFEHPWPQSRPVRRVDSSESCSLYLSDSASDSA